jgi:exopolyphosphatase/guanosine-5'-triphosphate,3'-diphosphate pyrophosphatase
LQLTEYDPGKIHLSQLPVAQITGACTSLLLMTRAERAALPFLHQGRVDVIGAGALVWRTIILRLEREAGITAVVTSEHDILDGIALSIG